MGTPFEEESLSIMFPSKPEEIGEISISPSVVDLIVEWRIENFSSLSMEDGIWYCSPDFSFGEHTWYLGMSPNGSSKRGTSGYIDLRLIKYFFHRSINQEFSLSFKNVKGEKEHEKHVTKLFEGWNITHYFNQFLLRSELTIRRSELLPGGVLKVACTMKNMISAGSASNYASAEICASDSDSGECCLFKGNFATGSLSSHQRKCMQRLIKCPECLEVVVLQKWLDEHECQQERLEGTRSLCEDYKKVLLGGRHHDLILKVGDKELRAHRDILRARSRVFESMLDHDMKEKNTGIIAVPDCDPNAMELFLSYVYCGKIEALDHNNMLGLYYIADKYEMVELKRQCCNFIKKSLSLTNICSVIQLALKHSDSDLLEYATGYFSDNMLDIMQTVEWQFFLKDNSTVGNELLLKCFKKLKNAQT